MAKHPGLNVLYTDQARTELERIWVWNAEKYSVQHATDYLLFLESQINALGEKYADGQRIERFPTLRQITMKRSQRGEGHVAIYEIDESAGTVSILHVYHTQQDIHGRLESEEP